MVTTTTLIWMGAGATVWAIRKPVHDANSSIAKTNRWIKLLMISPAMCAREISHHLTHWLIILHAILANNRGTCCWRRYESVVVHYRNPRPTWAEKRSGAAWSMWSQNLPRRRAMVCGKRFF